MTLTDIDIRETCEEIETQWEYHLMTRAIFYSTFPDKNEFRSPSFYRKNGMDFQVKLPETKMPSFDRASKGIGVWLNQNYVIRLFGILDSKQIIKYGLDNEIKIIKLIKLMRNNIGAHSTGRQANRLNELRTATGLINELFGRQIDLEKVASFTLSVDSVLYPMKCQTVSLIQGLSDKNVE
jgi:hypothetical protein